MMPHSMLSNSNSNSDFIKMSSVSSQMFSVGSGGLARAFWAFRACAQDCSKRLRKVQKGAKGLKRRSKRLFEPARCCQCARRGCSSLLRCRLCVRRGCSRLLLEIAVRKCWARLHCALRPLYSALLCSVHVYARVYTSIYIYSVCFH